nr:hypothetical protein [Thermostichus vulcanus]
MESTLQPLLAAALRELLELAQLIPAHALIASNFGLCSTVGDKVVVKAPDWVYVPRVKPIPEGEIRRSYTPHLEGDPPAIVMEFVSETEGGEYSINPHYNTLSCSHGDSISSAKGAVPSFSPFASLGSQLAAVKETVTVTWKAFRSLVP